MTRCSNSSSQIWFVAHHERYPTYRAAHFRSHPLLYCACLSLSTVFNTIGPDRGHTTSTVTHSPSGERGGGDKWFHRHRSEPVVVFGVQPSGLHVRANIHQGFCRRWFGEGGGEDLLRQRHVALQVDEAPQEGCTRELPVKQHRVDV